MQPLSYLETAVEVARSAADLVRTRYQRPFERLDKVGLDFATDTDLAAERLIVQALTGAFPEHAVLGEESGWSAGGPGARYSWLVDPLCGTLNFASGIPLFCINLALMEADRLVLGVVAEPASGDLYWAEQGGGAFRQSPVGEVERLRASPRARLLDLDLASNPSSEALAAAQRLLGAAFTSRSFIARSLSTSLSLPYVASGRLAATVHFDITSTGPVHFAAGVLICLEAGCSVTDLGGCPWSVDSVDLLAAADEATHGEVQELLATAV